MRKTAVITMKNCSQSSGNYRQYCYECWYIFFAWVSWIFRCLSVAYSPTRRECRLSGYDQRDSRILYDPLFDYYENLAGSSNSIGKYVHRISDLNYAGVWTFRFLVHGITFNGIKGKWIINCNSLTIHADQCTICIVHKMAKIACEHA